MRIACCALVVFALIITMYCCSAESISFSWQGEYRCFMLDGYYGLETRNEIVIPALYSGIKPLCGTLCAVQNDAYRWGLWDIGGYEILPCIFDDIEIYQPMVILYKDMYTHPAVSLYNSSTGEMAGEDYTSIEKLSSGGYAAVRYTDNGNQGTIDFFTETGLLAFCCSMMDYSDGNPAVMIRSDANVVSYYICGDKTMFETCFQYGTPFYGGYAVVKDIGQERANFEDKKYYIIGVQEGAVRPVTPKYPFISGCNKDAFAYRESVLSSSWIIASVHQPDKVLGGPYICSDMPYFVGDCYCVVPLLNTTLLFNTSTGEYMDLCSLCYVDQQQEDVLVFSYKNRVTGWLDLKRTSRVLLEEDGIIEIVTPFVGRFAMAALADDHRYCLIDIDGTVFDDIRYDGAFYETSSGRAFIAVFEETAESAGRGFYFDEELQKIGTFIPY